MCRNRWNWSSYSPLADRQEVAVRHDRVEALDMAPDGVGVLRVPHVTPGRVRVCGDAIAWNPLLGGHDARHAATLSNLDT